MSYDTSIIIDTGGEYLAEVETVGNMTSNVGPMYYRVLPGPYAGGGRYDGTREAKPDQGGLPGLSGLRCDVAAQHIDEALRSMAERAAELRALEPNNGWGDYDVAVRYLTQIAAACRRHPKGTLAVNW